jgi:hypothetical protein
MSTHYRQGDVLIQRIAKLPAKLKAVPRENGRIVLAHGEVTGHAHAIAEPEAELYAEDTAGVTYLEVKAAMAALQHEEHSTINLERGAYRVIRQREYSPEAIRNVAD